MILIDFNNFMNLLILSSSLKAVKKRVKFSTGALGYVWENTIEIMQWWIEVDWKFTISVFGVFTKRIQLQVLDIVSNYWLTMS